MELLMKTCAVCGQKSLGINCAPLPGKRFLCATCDRAVRRYIKETTNRKFAPPARAFTIETLKAIVNGENPKLSLPGDDQAEEEFQATGAVGTAVRYNDQTRTLLIRPSRDVTGMNVHRKGRVISFDDIVSAEILDSGQALRDAPHSGKATSLSLELQMESGSTQRISFLTTQQNRRSYVYRQALQEATFLMDHLQSMGLKLR